MCENAINLSTSTIKHMRGVMWPFLFEFIIPKQYENSLNVVCKSLGTLAETLRDEDDEIYDLDYDVQVNKQTNKNKNTKTSKHHREWVLWFLSCIKGFCWILLDMFWIFD
jgi:hypothetical protein